MLTPVEFARFGGLNLNADPQEAGVASAIDGMDFTVAADGRLRSRPGTTTLAGSLSYTPSVLYRAHHVGIGDVIFASWGGIGQAGAGVYAYANNGVLASSHTAYNGSGGFAQFAESTTNYVYALGSTKLRRCHLNTLVWSDGATVVGTRIAVTPWDHRLAVSGGSTVYFSGPSDPTTFPEFVTLDGDDGEVIEDMIAWREFLLVFKQTKFYVFYTTEVATDGSPIFRYRPVIGLGAVYTVGKQKVIAAADDGVYFLGQDGVYVTAGGPARKVSQALDPWFRSESLPYSTLPARDDFSTGSLGVVNRTLYVCPDSTNSLTFMLDLDRNQWSVSSLATHAVAQSSVSSSDAETAILGLSSKISRVDLGASSGADSGVAFTTSYRTGFMNFGPPMGESVLREWLIDGTGTVTFKTAVNDAVSLGTGASVALGASPGSGRDRRAVRGRNVSLQLSGAGISVNRVVGNVRSARGPGEKAT